MHASFLWPLLVLSIAATVTHAQVISNAVCGSSFGWMSNSKSQTPCLVSAYLSAACGNGEWTIQALKSGSNYDPPSIANKTANRCACSWAVYNLIGACTACQGANPLTWAAYNGDCADFLSDTTYFPDGVTYSSDTSVPFWAGTKPSNWTNAQFNTNQAESLASEGLPDYNNTSPTTPSATSSSVPSTTTSSAPGATSSAASKSKSSVGPIVGGVVGGLVALAIAGACAYFFLYKPRKDIHSRDTLRESGQGYFRAMSDATHQPVGRGVGHGGIHQAMGARDNATSPNSTFAHVASLTGHSLITTNGIVQPSSSTAPENRVEPFVGVVGNPDLRKGANAARANAIGFNQVYDELPRQAAAEADHPDPISFAQAEQATGTNPPPYVETSDTTPPRPQVDELGHRRLRGEMGSGDTFDTSFDSNFNTSGDMTRSAGGSGSSLAQMGIVRPAANPSSFSGSVTNWTTDSIGQAHDADQPEL